MSSFISFLRNKVDKNALRFHYMRIAQAKPVLDELRVLTEDMDIEWIQHEVDAFRDYHFSESYAKFSGAVVNIHVSDDEIINFRRDFWENFIWKTEKLPIPLAIVIPKTTKYGSLTKAEIYEALSLIRLTDRPFELFESGDNVSREISDWLISLAAIIHRKESAKQE